MLKKQLLIVSKNGTLIEGIKERLSVNHEISIEKSIHAAFNIALGILPDIIFFDKVSYTKTSDFKNLRSFKSTHFLRKSSLIVYALKQETFLIQKRYKNIVDEIIPEQTGVEKICEKINRISASASPNYNYWHDCFMGLFNLMAKPVVLLEQNTIIAMNDDFRKTFKIEQTEGLKLTNFVHVENKLKVKESLRNFARGKHMKAITETSLLINEDKLRKARISFSKLSKNITDQFIMIIDFAGDEITINKDIGTHSNQVERCFENNGEMTEFCFTKREKEIIELLCKGYKTKEISDTLFISPKTIEKHRANIIKRTNSETILESIIYAINHNLVDKPVS